ncbi:MAG: hypothetical protein WC881_09570 [Elusimicrobiota bacterium]|jgi:hypothetical protein
MGTDNIAASVPEFKLAKVGKERRRRGGGGFWSLGGGSGSGSGAIGAISGLGGKVAVSLLVATLGAGAFGVGRVLAPDDKNFKADKKPKLFASAEKPKYAGDLSNLPGMQAQPSGLGMVAGSLDGMTSAEREAKAQADADAAKAAADAQAQADAQAAQQAAPQPGMPADPAALAAAAAGGNAAGADKSMNRKFGELSKGLGGLSGGSGMSGGFSRGFDSPKLGSSAGNLAGFNNARASVGRAQVRSANVGRAGVGLARRQLGSVAQLSKSAQGSAGHDMSAALASRGFDNNPAQGTAITGSGAGQGGSPTGAAGGGDTTTRNPVSGPIGGGGSASAPDDCSKFPDGGYINSSAGGCVKANAGTSVDPTDGLFKMLKLLAILSGIICGFLVAFSVFQWTWVGAALVRFLAGALVAIGALEAMLGIMVMGMGRTVEGGIFALLGAGTAYIGYASYTGLASGASGLFNSLSVTSQQVIAGLVAGMQLGAGLNSPGGRTMNADTNRWE